MNTVTIRSFVARRWRVLPLLTICAMGLCGASLSAPPVRVTTNTVGFGYGERDVAAGAAGESGPSAGGAPAGRTVVSGGSQLLTLTVLNPPAVSRDGPAERVTLVR
jgi:hypothetical protein